MTQALLATLLVLAQAPAPVAPPTGSSSPQAAPPRDPDVATPSDARPAGAAGEGYRIGPGDVLRVAVYGHEDLTQTVVVPPGGSFPFPSWAR